MLLCYDKCLDFFHEFLSTQNVNRGEKMPLLDPKLEKSFVQSTVVLVDSVNDRADGQTTSNFTVELLDKLSNVIGIEVIGYHIPEAYFSPLAQGHAVDFQLTNGTLGTDTMTAYLGSASAPLSLSSPPTNLELARITQAFDYAMMGNATYGGYGKVTVGLGASNMLSITSEPILGGATDITLQFSTGSNVADSAANALGFVTGVDVSGTGVGVTDRVATASSSNLGTEGSYIDISVSEAPELKPLVRVHHDDTSVTISDTGQRTRLLTDPIDKLERLNFELKMRRPDGTYGVLPLDLPIHLEVRLIYLDAAFELPDYATLRPLAL